ncbi:MAG: hypothetical protein ACYCT2_05800 [Thermoplasmataceae archaeon]
MEEFVFGKEVKKCWVVDVIRTWGNKRDSDLRKEFVKGLGKDWNFEIKERIRGKQTAFYFEFYGYNLKKKDLDNICKFYFDAFYEDLLDKQASKGKRWDDHLVQKIVAEKLETSYNRICVRISTIN